MFHAKVIRKKWHGVLSHGTYSATRKKSRVWTYRASDVGKEVQGAQPPISFFWLKQILRTQETN